MQIHANRLRTEAVVFQTDRVSSIESMLHKTRALNLPLGFAKGFRKFSKVVEATADTQVSKIMD